MDNYNRKPETKRLGFQFLPLMETATILSQVSIIMLLMIGTSFASPIQIRSIEMKRDRGYDYLDVYTSGWSKATGLLLEDRLYIDFPDASFAKGVTVAKKRSARIERIELVKPARIIVHLKKKIDYDVVNVFGRDKTVVEIGDRLDGLFTRQLAWEKADVKKRGQPLKPIKFVPAAAGALKGRTIVIDPGHGGDDPGAFSRDSKAEKNLTLPTAQTLATLLREAGATVYLTRDEDRRANLKDVAAFANRSGADIFISLHYNSSYDHRLSGSETYYYNPVSRRFAETLHEAVVRGLGRRDRGLHRVPFYVIKNTEMPSVLLEPLYLTDADESGLADSPRFRTRLAENIVKGVETYFRDRVH